MDKLEVTITIRLEVYDTDNKVDDCLTAIDAARALLNTVPGDVLLQRRNPPPGGSLVTITKLRRMYSDGVVAACIAESPRGSCLSIRK